MPKSFSYEHPKAGRILHEDIKNVEWTISTEGVLNIKFNDKWKNGEPRELRIITNQPFVYREEKSLAQPAPPAPSERPAVEVREVEDEPVTPEVRPKFKVGDKVKVIGSGLFFGVTFVVSTVTEYGGSFNYAHATSGAYEWFEEELELVSEN